MNRLELSNEEKIWLGEQVIKQINDEDIVLTEEWLLENVKSENKFKWWLDINEKENQYLIRDEEGFVILVTDDIRGCFHEEVDFAKQITTLSKLKQLYSLLTGDSLPMKDNLTVK